MAHDDCVVGARPCEPHNDNQSSYSGSVESDQILPSSHAARHMLPLSEILSAYYRFNPR